MLTSAENRVDYFNYTIDIFLLLLRLFNSNEGTASILGSSHKGQSGNLDLLEFYSPFFNETLGLYCASNGDVVYSLRSEDSKAESHAGEKAKVPSTGSKLGDAGLIAESLKEFAKAAKSQVSIDGSTDDEPLIAMTLPQGASIAPYGNWGDVLGVVFKPIVRSNNRAVHGTMNLLVRKKLNK